MNGGDQIKLENIQLELCLLRYLGGKVNCYFIWLDWNPYTSVLYNLNLIMSGWDDDKSFHSTRLINFKLKQLTSTTFFSDRYGRFFGDMVEERR